MNQRKMYPKQKVYWGLYSGHRRKRDDTFVREVQATLETKLLPTLVSIDETLVGDSKEGKGQPKKEECKTEKNT